MKKIFVLSILFILPAWGSEHLPNLQAGYLDGFYLQSPDGRYRIKMGARLNFGYTYAFLDGSDDYSSFDLHHAKFFLGGNVFSPNIQYFVQTGSAQNTRSRLAQTVPSESLDGSFVLEDYFVRLAKGSNLFQLGQFKVPLARQWMIYSGNLQFMGRSKVTNAFHFGRDRGITYTSRTPTLNLTAGVFNGGSVYQIAYPQEGLQNSSNDASNGVGHLYTARMAMVPFGAVGFSEGDVENSEGHRLEIGSSFVFDQNRDVDTTGDAITDLQSDFYVWSADMTWKHLGKSFQSEFFYRKGNTGLAVDYDGLGVYAQAGYFVVPSQWELAGRFGWLDNNLDQPSDELFEASVVSNIHFFQDHRYKLQMQYTWLLQETLLGDQKHHMVDVGLQLSL